MEDKSKGGGNPVGGIDGRENGSPLKGQVREDIKKMRGADSNPLEEGLRDRRRKEILAFCRESRTNFLKRSGRDVLGTVPEKCSRMLKRKQAKHD